MGAALSDCLHPPELTLDKPWMSWQNHPQARLYAVGRRLGSGAFSEVYLARKKPAIIHGEDVALKVIFLGNPKLSASSIALLKQESEILQKLNHRNIVNVKATYMDEKTQVLIIEEEYLVGEELLDAAQEAITHHGFTITESFAARVKGVLHRDLKVENLRLTLPTKKWVEHPHSMHLKIIDFGLSCRMSDNPEPGWLGSPGYVAPEVIDNQPHTPKMDMFACGVILFMLLTGMKPCDNDLCTSLAYSKFEANEYPNMIDNKRWDSVSAAGQDLVLKLMERDPAKRYSASQALEHPFMKKALSTASSARYAFKPEDMAPEDIKETDQLQADAAFQKTAEQERWRDLVATVKQVRTAMQAKPHLARSSASPMQDKWRHALARAYLRTKQGAADFTAGRLGHLSTPMPSRMALARHRSLSTGAFNAVKAAEVAKQTSHDLGGASSEPGPETDTADTPCLTPADAGIGAAPWVKPKPATALGQGKYPLSPEEAGELYQQLRKCINKRMEQREKLMLIVEEAVIEKQEGLDAIYALEEKLLHELSSAEETQEGVLGTINAT